MDEPNVFLEGEPKTFYILNEKNQPETVVKLAPDKELLQKYCRHWNAKSTRNVDRTFGLVRVYCEECELFFWEKIK